MGRKLEWELSGKSDVPEKMAKAKSSMDGMASASDALGKKFKDAFKDIALGFVAPMILVQKAIGFITDKIAEAKQKAEEARAFAKEEESKKYAPAGGREAILQHMEKLDEEEKKRKGQDLASQGYKRFMEEDPRGKVLWEQLKKEGKVKSFAGYNYTDDPEVAKDIKARIDAIIMPDIAARQAAEDAEEAKKKASKDKDASKSIGIEAGSNVVGVGMSPQLDALNRSVAIQEDMANSLRTLIERDQAESGFKTEKFFPSARRLPTR